MTYTESSLRFIARPETHSHDDATSNLLFGHFANLRSVLTDVCAGNGSALRT